MSEELAPEIEEGNMEIPKKFEEWREYDSLTINIMSKGNLFVRFWEWMKG